MAKRYEKTFHGQRISDFGLKNHKVDYNALSKSFDCILCNNILEQVWDGWSIESGSSYYYCDSSGNKLDEKAKDLKLKELKANKEMLKEKLNNPMIDDVCYEKINNKLFDIKGDIRTLMKQHQKEFDQYYIISDEGARILSEETDMPVLYNEVLDIYLWCVEGCGGDFEYRLTNIPCN